MDNAIEFTPRADDQQEQVAIDMATSADDGFRDGKMAANAELAATLSRSMSEVINGVPMELLLTLCMEREGERWTDAMIRLQAILYKQPQASSGKSASAGEREAFRSWCESICYPAALMTCGDLAAFKAGAAWQRTKSAGVPDAWRDALQKIARHAPPVNCAAKTEVEKLALIAVHALIAFSAPQFSKPTDHQSAKVGTAAPAQPAAQGEFGDSYQGAREDLAIWKRSALEADARVRQQDQIIDHLTLEVQGETRMGDPVIPASHDQGEAQRLREALEQVLALFPAGIIRQSFVINSGPALRADDDDEFYSAKKVGRLLDQVVGIIRDALASSTEPCHG